MSFNRPAAKAHPAGTRTNRSTSSRPLTQGEIDLAKKVFKDSINYSLARIHNEGYLPFHLQEDGTAMAPNGEIYFKPADFRVDFSLGSDAQKTWFIHELTHVWQHQLGYNVLWRGAARIGLDYDYKLTPAQLLADHNMEAQGDIIADYFAIAVLKNRGAIRNQTARKNPQIYTQELYEHVLRVFISDPSDKANLP
jgi:hypothetical protein